MSQGKIVQITGPAVDVKFPPGQLPSIHNALEVDNPLLNCKLTLEVALHLGNDIIRTVAMGPTDGLRRDLPVKDTGKPISVPVCNRVLGRIFNVLGETIDGIGRSTAAAKNGRFTARHRHTDSRAKPLIFSKPGSRSSTCLRPTRAAAKLACSVEPASAKPF